MTKSKSSSIRWWIAVSVIALVASIDPSAAQRPRVRLDKEVEAATHKGKAKVRVIVRTARSSRMVLKETVVNLEVKKPAGKWEKVSVQSYAKVQPDPDTSLPLGLGLETIPGFTMLMRDADRIVLCVDATDGVRWEIAHVLQGVERKRDGFEALLAQLGLKVEHAGYMGDELVDLPVLTRCGFACAPAQAPEAVRRRVHYVAAAPAGRGAAREVCELVMQAQGSLERALQEYLA